MEESVTALLSILPLRGRGIVSNSCLDVIPVAIDKPVEILIQINATLEGRPSRRLNDNCAIVFSPFNYDGRHVCGGWAFKSRS